MVPFEYRTPRSLKELHRDQAELGGDAKLIAGGTALVIMMRQRLVRPACLISLRSIRALDRIDLKDGGVEIGGGVTHRTLERSPLIRTRWPVLAETYAHVATIRVRNMATVGGGLAHADPNQDPPPTLIALGAAVKASSATATRTIPMEDFFTDYYETVLKPDEVVSGVFVPALPANSGSAFLKFLPRTADDYATVSAAAVVTLDRARRVFQDVRLALGSVGVTPIRARDAEAVLCGQPIRGDGLRDAAEKAKQAVDPIGDFRGSAAYKREMAGVFARRALEQALARVLKKSRPSPKSANRRIR